MASRKGLKKNVNYIIGELFTECLIRCINADEENRNKLNSIMGTILSTQDEFITRISHTQKGSEKEFYKKFKKDFSEQVTSIVDQIFEIK